MASIGLKKGANVTGLAPRQEYEYKVQSPGVDGMGIVVTYHPEDHVHAGKMMTQQQASLQPPTRWASTSSTPTSSTRRRWMPPVWACLGTRLRGQELRDGRVLHRRPAGRHQVPPRAVRERLPAGGWPMKYALLGEYNPTMSSVIGTKTGYGAYYPKEQKASVEHKHVKATVPDSAKDQWALPMFRRAAITASSTPAPSRRPSSPALPPPTRYQRTRPRRPSPTTPSTARRGPTARGELKKPDPAWGYTGREHARRRRRRRGSLHGDPHREAAPGVDRAPLCDSPRRPGQGLGPRQAGCGKTYQYGWSSFPPRGLEGAEYKPKEEFGLTGNDLQPSQIRGPNNAQISSAKLYASNGN